MIPRAAMLAAVGAALLALPLLAGCQSTQSQSAEIEAEGATALKDRKGVTVTEESAEVKVTATKALTDQNGSAVVISLRNTSGQDLRNVPIAIDALNAKGKSVFKNDLPGLEPSLTAIPFMRAGESADWVHDQVLAAGPVQTVEARVGTVPAGPLPELPRIEVSEPKLEIDPVSGTQAVGDVVNRSGAEQRDLLLYAVARKGGDVVAAGRGIIAKLKSSAKPAQYHIYFIGDPTGSDVSVTAFPSLKEG